MLRGVGGGRGVGESFHETWIIERTGAGSRLGGGAKEKSRIGSQSMVGAWLEGDSFGHQCRRSGAVGRVAGRV